MEYAYILKPPRNQHTFEIQKDEKYINNPLLFLTFPPWSFYYFSFPFSLPLGFICL